VLTSGPPCSDERANGREELEVARPGGEAEAAAQKQEEPEEHRHAEEPQF
jgi:hypothetical protein